MILGTHMGGKCARSTSIFMKRGEENGEAREIKRETPTYLGILNLNSLNTNAS